MQDSPLSVAASVTGFLTFVAAIIGFVYVRYVSLRNGYREPLETMTSVAEDLYDRQDMLQHHVRSNSSDFGRLRPLIDELYVVEVDIIAHCLVATGETCLDFIRKLRDNGQIRLPTTPTDGSLMSDPILQDLVEQSRIVYAAYQHAWENRVKAVREMLRPRLFGFSGFGGYFGRQLEKRTHYLQNATARGRLENFQLRLLLMRRALISSQRRFLLPPLALFTVFAFTFGETPKLTRWYAVRGKVRSKMRKREMLQSRHLRYHLSNSLQFAELKQEAISISERMDRLERKMADSNDAMRKILLEQPLAWTGRTSEAS